MEGKNTVEKVGARKWLIFIIVGFAGQLAWSLENMYLNSFLFSLGYSGYENMIFWTEALSAITACITTIIMGGLSDKLGRRKVFICGGYILWGLSTAAFGLVSIENVSFLFPVVAVTQLSSVLVIILDCVMTFFGSTANDACFNSFITKSVKPENCGKVEGVICVLPLMSMLAITVLYSFTGDQHWDYFFYIVGGIVLLVGIIAIFLMPKEIKEKSNEPYYKFLIEGFKIKTIKANPFLYITLLCDFVYCAASQIFFPYMIIYFNKTLEYVDTSYLILLGGVLIGGAILSVIGGFILDKVDKVKSLIPCSILYVIGLLSIMIVGKNQLPLAMVCGIIMMFGYIIVSTIINALIRDYTPKGKEGTFQGIRMIFQVALPMVTGPFIAKLIVSNLATDTYINDFGEVQNLPPKFIWLFAAIGTALILIPVIWLIIKRKKVEQNKNEGLLYEQDSEN